MPDTLIEELRGFGAHCASHSHRSLLEHLVGVRNILLGWRNSASVANAGLFHSVYGTPAYGRTLLPLEARPRIRSLIGVDSELLVYLFCACDQREIVHRAAQGQPDELLDRFIDANVAIPLCTFKWLCEIGVANLLEQIQYLRTSASAEQIARVLRAWTAVQPYVSAPAWENLRQAQVEFERVAIEELRCDSWNLG